MTELGRVAVGVLGQLQGFQQDLPFGPPLVPCEELGAGISPPRRRGSENVAALDPGVELAEHAERVPSPVHRARRAALGEHLRPPPRRYHLHVGQAGVEEPVGTRFLGLASRSAGRPRNAVSTFVASAVAPNSIVSASTRTNLRATGNRAHNAACHSTSGFVPGGATSWMSATAARSSDRGTTSHSHAVDRAFDNQSEAWRRTSHSSENRGRGAGRLALCERT